MNNINHDVDYHSNIDSSCLNFKDGLLTFTTFYGLKSGELIIGDRQTGKTTIRFDLWQNQTNLNFKGLCFLEFLRSIIEISYMALIGQKKSNLMSIYTEVESSMMEFSPLTHYTSRSFSKLGTTFHSKIQSLINREIILIAVLKQEQK